MRRKLSTFELTGGAKIRTLDRKLRGEIRVLNEIIVVVQGMIEQKEQERQKSMKFRSLLRRRDSKHHPYKNLG